MAIAGNARALTGPELAGQFDRGLKAYDAKQYQEAFQIWSQIKDRDLAARRNVALMLRKGQGVTKDPQKAEEILRTAAATGMSNAQVDLAEMYLNGETGPANPKRALPLLQSAAAGGHPLGQFLLGRLYEDGNAVPKDVNKATELYISAARGGLQQAKERLASLGDNRSVKSPAVPLASAKPPASADSAAGPQKPAVTEHLSANSIFVQLGAFRTAAAAQAQWEQARKNPALASLSHQVEQADLGAKGAWYRLLVASGPDRKAAITLCDQIKATGIACLVRPSFDRTATAKL
jgi:TPR repeat protein